MARAPYGFQMEVEILTPGCRLMRVPVFRGQGMVLLSLVNGDQMP